MTPTEAEDEHHVDESGGKDAGEDIPPLATKTELKAWYVCMHTQPYIRYPLPGSFSRRPRIRGVFGAPVHWPPRSSVPRICTSHRTSRVPFFPDNPPSESRKDQDGAG